MTATIAETDTPTVSSVGTVPDVIFYCPSGDGYSRRVLIEPAGEKSLEMRWYDSAGVARIATTLNFRDMTPTDLAQHATAVAECATLLAAFEQAHRLQHLHPSRFGLVARDGHPLGQSDPRQSDGGGLLANVIPAPLLAPTLDHRSVGTGWFHPDADPNAFGTNYLVPVFAAAPHPQRNLRGETGWRLRTVGVTHDGVFVSWNDVEGMRAAIQRTAEDPEIVATEHVLMDSEGAAQDLMRHTRRIHVLSAREAFASKKTQVRPRLTQEAAEKAVHSYRNSGENGWMHVSSMRHDLAPYDVMGYDRSGLSLWAGWTFSVGRSRARWTDGQSVVPDTTMTHSEAREKFANFLIGNVRERSLGKVALVEGAEEADSIVVLTMRPDLVEQFPRAFGLPEGITLRVLN